MYEKELNRNKLTIQNRFYSNKLVSKTKELQALAFDTLEAIEIERTQLVNDMNDTFGSILACIRMDLVWIKKKTQSKYPEIVDKISKMQIMIEQGIHVKRQLVEYLHPSIISDKGFWTALRILIQAYNEKNQWELKQNLPLPIIKLNQLTELIAFRVLQTTLGYANNQPRINKVSVEIKVEQNYLNIIISYNEIVFDLKSLDMDSQRVKSVRYAVFSIGGKYDIKSDIGVGTTSSISIPLAGSGII